DFCRACPGLRKLVYFSTCYVAGDRQGVIKEDELEARQGFKNHYEATKYAAEVEVRRAIDKGLPVIIIRPSIVVGDSQTGETGKFDGPYFGMRFIDHFKWLPVGLPMLGPSLAFVNLTPVDFLIDATLVIAAKPGSVGKTFQVADPAPTQAKEIYKELCLRITGREPGGLCLQPALVGFILGGPIGKLLGVPAQVLTYFNHDARFDTANTDAALVGSDVRCPVFKTYVDAIYRYWQAHHKEPGRSAKY
ncbi:MAG: SDR family oxidoreductase, partial [Elusimicrobiota bacterium]